LPPLPPWTADGGIRFLAYTVVFWAVAAFLRPKHLLPVAAVFVLLYTAWWSGPAAPLAVLYFLGSCQTLIGVAGWIFAIGIALHFPINTPAVYLIALGIPYLVSFFVGPPLRAAARLLPGLLSLPRFPLALLLFVLMAHWLVALKPDVSSDALSIHLALPAAVADQRRWAFDFRNYSWAVMPSGVDGLYTAVYLLGAEPAARLLNFAFLVISAVLVIRIARRWVSLEQAMMAAALFVSTPIVQLVTGSLFIENAWTALLLGAVLALLRYLDDSNPGQLAIIGVLLGAALSSKLIAAAFVLPIAAIAGAVALWRGQGRKALLAAALLLLIGLPPYAYARVVTGNPIFPFSNRLFRSPYYPSAQSFDDPRYHAPLSWKTPYLLTFRSEKYIEGQGGAAGFQYFLLLLPAALLLRRRDQAILFAAAALPATLILIVLPNLRYLYPALPLFSVAFAWLPGAGYFTPALIALNLWFAPAAGPYDRDFALFRKSEIAPYLERMSPARLLIDHLNRAAPGEPVAFFSTDTIAGLRAPAYSDNWHSELYWQRVREAPKPEVIARIFKELKIRHVVAPASREALYPALRAFLASWIEPDGPTAGNLAVFRVRDSAKPVEHDTRPLIPGTYDDSEPRIEYTGSWFNDRQFTETSSGSITYSNVPGDKVKLVFEGVSISYSYTQAANRGLAEIRLDGQVKTRINQYSANTQWQNSTEFADVGPGTHTFEIIVTGEKDPRSADVYVDLDRIVIK
jgi:hypothetical protein